MVEKEEFQRDFKGIWMPKEIYLCSDLTWTEKILYCEISSLDNEGGCFASNKYFADFLGVSETVVSLGISKLKAFGLIETVSFDGRKRILKIKAGFNETERQGLRKLKGSIEENLKYNNIYNNINNNKKNINKKTEDDIKIIEGWNNIAKKWQLPTISLLTDKRKAKLLKILQKYKYTLEDFYGILEDRIKKSLFLQGVVQKRDGSGGYIFEHSAKWHCDFDFFLQESSFVKTVDNTYTDGDLLK